MIKAIVGATVAAALLLVTSGPAAVGRLASPAAIFTTWVGDPTTSVSIDWHMLAGTDIPALEIRPLGAPTWNRVDGVPVRFPHSTRTVRRADVRNLVPATTYELRIGGSRTYRYRTMPVRMTRPIRFATGGDTQADEARFGPMNRIAAALDVDVVVFGGDLAYSNGDPRLVAREEAWFETVTRTLVTPDGRLIPVVAAIGNHEVFANRDTTEAGRRMVAETGVKRGEATYYAALHAHARLPHYRVVDVGDYLSLVLLNTNHTAPIAGAQSAWLDSVLAARTHVPYVFPVYHVPAYPSVRSFDGSGSRQVREHWVPRFEQHGVRVAFENHDHAYKRTVPLKNGRLDSTGVVYIGDGAWGAGPRELGRDHQAPANYLATSSSAIHGIFVTLDGRRAQFEMVDSAGFRFDSYALTASRRLIDTAAATRAAVGHRAPADGGTAPSVASVREHFVTRPDTLSNVDGPAVWHGPAGQHWLLVTAKSLDAILVHDAATGAPIRHVGGPGTGPGKLRRPNGITVIGDIALVVERDNHRVQAFHLPTFTPAGTFGESVLRFPYGITSYEVSPGSHAVYVTDNYEMPDESVPPDAALGERVKQFRIDVVPGGIASQHVRSFGDTVGAGVLRVVESIAVDPVYGRVLVAEETETDSHIKVYDLDGRFTGRVVGRGLFPQQAEGLALLTCGERGGYWIATDQGDETNTLHLLDRASLEQVASFTGAVTRRTDGIALTQARFGPFPAGALYATHVDAGVSALSWADIARATGVRADCPH